MLKNRSRSSRSTESELATLFNALGDHTRIRLLRLLAARPGICVGELALLLELSASAVSQQLRLLEIAGITERRRVGQRTCYGIRRSDAVVRSLMRMLGVFKK